jgi:NAD(P)-dependent dehydrogenase (short-subunit alcohol dehydrogenase family)
MRGTALVTGAGRRIGRAIALGLAQAGFDIAVHTRHADEDSASLAVEVEALGRRAAVVLADLSVEAEVETLIDRAFAALGPLKVLVNNASVFVEDDAASMTRETWDTHFETNLRAPLLLAQRFAAQAPDGAVVINLTDQRVWKPTPQFLSYALSKSALWDATRMLAQALAPRIRVNAVGPGPTLASIHQTPESFAAEAASTLLGHGVSPHEIAAAVLYLVDAPSVTGQMVAVDAGQHLVWMTPDVVTQAKPQE